ncbi:carboxypeptidase-like regulatory domain-containing protein [Sungkyunkwania multivorans]|uniref:Carboxypeptidase-like regulatory domain-containing protein n=1 Tax=Sungkyunkwania multivorans TaxID=1173618 RepID=A0ABW3CWY5_9FLAO
MEKASFLYTLLFLSTSIINAQNLEGVVLDGATNVPLEGASVYYDGTTIGTITNAEGYFDIEKRTDIAAPLIISYVGYFQRVFDDISDWKKRNILLKPNNIKLGEVVLTADPWTRAKKLRYFRSAFLGRTLAAADCSITNEDDIKLRYDPTTKKLTAYAEKPLVVKNSHLGYTVQFNLLSFEAIFEKPPSGFFFMKQSYYSGTSFFKELNSKTKRKTRTNRKTNYLGSTMHFFRAMATKQLLENDFKIFKGSYQIDPYAAIELQKEGEFTRVTLSEKRLNVLYDQIEQSSLHKVQESFYIDTLGNFTPTNAIMFGGEFGLQGVANMLPLDYKHDRGK